eukprot:6525253-Pyramimonas_sp.AAC.1
MGIRTRRTQRAQKCTRTRQFCAEVYTDPPICAKVYTDPPTCAKVYTDPPTCAQVYTNPPMCAKVYTDHARTIAPTIPAEERDARPSDKGPIGGGIREYTRGGDQSEEGQEDMRTLTG